MGDNIWTLDAQLATILKKRRGKAVCVLSQLHEIRSAGIPDRLIVDIGNIHHVPNLVALESQVALQNVLEHKSPKVPDVGIVVDRRPTRVHSYVVLDQRLK